MIAVRKQTSAVVHASEASGRQWAGADVYEVTSCGRKIAADGTWTEVSTNGLRRALANVTPHYVSDLDLRTCKRCASALATLADMLTIREEDDARLRRENAAFEAADYADDVAQLARDSAHSAALAEDAARDSAALAARLDADPGEQRARRERAEWQEDRRRAAERDEAERITAQQRRTRVAWSGVSLTDQQRRDRDVALALNPAYRRTHPEVEQTSAPEVRPDTPWREGDPAPRLIVADYGRLGWGEEAGPRHVVREVRGVDSDHGYDVGTLQQDDRDGTGTQGAADTLCGVVAYGVMYWPAQGPAVDCQACILSDDVRPADLAEHVTAPMPEDLVPTVWDAVCEYCKRYRRPCGRHEVTGGPAGVCRHCEQSVWQDSHGSWIDATDGDGCDSPSGVHEVTSGHAPVGGPVPIAVTVTSAMLGSDAGPHLWELYRNTVVDASAQDEIAAAYDALPLRSTERIVGLAWQAFEEETLSQARVLRAHKVHYNVVTTDPYANAGELFADLRDTGTIRVLSSRVTGGHPILPDHVNDAFRAVHDILGHAATGRGFDRHGEEAAFQAHSVLYSPLARLALATETRGQNASMLRASGVFPPERIAILPEWARALDALQWRDAWNRAPYADAARDHATQGLGRWGS